MTMTLHNWSDFHNADDFDESNATSSFVLLRLIAEWGTKAPGVLKGQTDLWKNKNIIMPNSIMKRVDGPVGEDHPDDNEDFVDDAEDDDDNDDDDDDYDDNDDDDNDDYGDCKF